MSPAAALRVLRIAAGRRALELVLLVGGLFVIGLLCGGQASAADGVSVAGVSATEVPVAGVPVGTASTTASKPAAPRHGEGHRGGKGQALHSAPVPAPMAEVGHLAGSVTEELAKAPSLPALPSLPTPPSMPEAPESPEWQSPEWPDWPGLDLPAFPGMPGDDIPALPGVPAVPGETLPAPSASAPLPPAAPQPEAAEPGSGDGRDDKGRTDEVAAVAYGPSFVAVADDTASRVAAADGAHSVASAGYAPVRQASVDHPGGVLGNRSAGDSGTSRHGDAHAVSLNPRAPLRLVPGAAARVEADEIQDRHRDIPVSPA